MLSYDDVAGSSVTATRQFSRGAGSAAARAVSAQHPRTNAKACSGIRRRCTDATVPAEPSGGSFEESISRVFVGPAQRRRSDMNKALACACVALFSCTGLLTQEGLDESSQEAAWVPSPPAMTATPPPVIRQTTATLGFSSQGAGSYRCSLDGAAFAACTSPVALSALSPARHTFSAKAVSARGRESAATVFSWVVDLPGTVGADRTRRRVGAGGWAGLELERRDGRRQQGLGIQRVPGRRAGRRDGHVGLPAHRPAVRQVLRGGRGGLR